MSDPDPSSAPPPVIDHEPQPGPAPAAAVTRRRGGTPLPLTLLLTACLGGGLYWVWTNPKGSPGQAVGDQQPAIEAARTQIMAAVQSQTQALSGRVDALEKVAQQAPGPNGASADDATKRLDALSGRLDALEKTPRLLKTPAVSQEAFADAAKKMDDLSSRIDTLSAKQDAQAAELQKTREIAAQRPAETAAPPPDTTASQVPALIAGQQAADMGNRLARQKAADDEALAEQKSALDGLQQRLAKLEAGAGQAADALKQRTAQGEAQASAQVLALGARVEKLEQGSGQAQSEEQEQSKTAGQALAQANAQVAALGARLETLEKGSGQVQSLEQVQAKTTEQEQARIAALDTRVQKLEQGAGQVQGAAQNASRAIRIEAAQAALASGQPVGSLPDAPPALARFATTAPPTESGLRAAFPQVAEAARAASQPDFSKRSFLDRALARVQQSVTVRRGDHVLVGDPAAGVLARAQDALNAGDLKRAADILGTLNGAAAAAASGWVGQARSLIDARAALAAMAHS